MALRILSFYVEGVTWRVAETLNGYSHRQPSGMPEWQSGIPEGISEDVVATTFNQFSPDDPSLSPTRITFKLTYRVGLSEIDCYLFSSSEGDLFSIKIPPATFHALHKAFPYQSFPQLRVARLAVEQAIHHGVPECELAPESIIFEQVRNQLLSAPVK